MSICLLLGSEDWAEAKKTNLPWGFDWRHGSLAYKLQNGGNRRRALLNIDLPADPSVPDNTLEGMLTSVAKAAINEIAPIDIKFIDLPDNATPYPLTLLEKRTLIPKLYELIILTFLAPVPDQLTKNHMNRIRILRALAPIICRSMNQTFNEALGECVEPPTRTLTNYQPWNLTSFIDDSKMGEDLTSGLGDLSSISVGIEEHWPDYEHEDIQCADELF